MPVAQVPMVPLPAMAITATSLQRRSSTLKASKLRHLFASLPLPAHEAVPTLSVMYMDLQPDCTPSIPHDWAQLTNQLHG